VCVCVRVRLLVCYLNYRMHGATMKITQSYGLCAVALLLALTCRYGVEPHVLADVSLMTDCCVTMEVPSETSDFYTLWTRLIELENFQQQAIRVVM